MTTTAYRADEWDRFNAMPAPAEVFIMTCPEGHQSEWSHREWHMLDTGACPRECPGRIDFAHARRHVDCPCDEEVLTAPGDLDTAPAGETPTAPALRNPRAVRRFPTFIPRA